MLNYSLAYRKVNVPTLDASGHKQYDENGILITHTEIKAYATAQSESTMSLSDFASACIVSGNVAWSRADILAFISDISGFIEQVLLNGQGVDLGELGKFAPRISSTGCDSEEDWVASKYIKKAFAGWTRGEDLKDFKDSCTFNLVDTRATEASLKKLMRSGGSQIIINRSVSAAEAAASGQLTKHLLTLAISPVGGGVVNGGGNISRFK